LITVMRALAFAHNGRQPLLHRCGVPVVKRMTVLPRTDASTFYKRVGFNPLCGVYTWFPQDPLLLSRFRLEHLWDDSPHHPVHTHYTRTRACAHVTHTHLQFKKALVPYCSGPGDIPVLPLDTPLVPDHLLRGAMHEVSARTNARAHTHTLHADTHLMVVSGRISAL